MNENKLVDRPDEERSILHVVLTTWRQGFPFSERARLEQLVREFVQMIPGVLVVRCGRSVSPEGLEGGYDWGLSVKFQDRAARDGYLIHPCHDPVKTIIESWAEGIIVFDLPA